jgi:3-hydroxybutyryl-CoA dehydrogenase
MESIEDIGKMAVIGAGVMGHGIAEIYALNGYSVSLMDVDEEILEKNMILLKSELKTLVANEFTTKEASKSALRRISTSTSIEEAVDGCNYVTEAVVENLDIKRKVFKKLEALLAEDAILASNTSGLMISKIAKGLKKPDRVIGTHFSVPPHIIPGVEIIRGNETSDLTFQIAYDLIKKIGKMPFVVKKEIDGFILNRLQLALAREAFYLVENGVADPEDVDICLNSVLGFRWATIGPFRQMDSAGVDSWYNVGSYLFPSLSNSKEVPKPITEKVKKGELGMKKGKGFYDYSKFRIEDVITERDDGFLKTLKLMRTIWRSD